MNTANALFAGFGGHGMLLAGKLLALAAMDKGKQVSWLPAYGAEMRGGTANATVCISDDQVGSPYIERPSALIVMNTPSLEKFGPRVQPGGTIVVNSTLAREAWDRDDCTVYSFAAGDMAREQGSPKSTNLVLLGAYVALTRIVEAKAIIEAIENQFATKPHIMKSNVTAFRAGYNQAKAWQGRTPIDSEKEQGAYAHSDTNTTG